MKYNIRNVIFRALPDTAESKSCLGIYLTKDTATVICFSSQGRDCSVLDCFSISSQEQQERNPQGRASLISQGCAERGFAFSEVAVALDCAMFMQHNVHSDFNEPKQLAATVRFDTEEALAKDITEVAIAFNIISSDQAGSQLSVFTAQRKILSDILLALQSNNIDPITIEPDINCLSRFICQKISSPESQRGGTLFGMLSRRSGYLIIPQLSAGLSTQKTPIVRTFLIGPTQNRNELLAREVLMTTASGQIGEPINCLKVFDSSGSIDYKQLSNKLRIEVSALDLAGSVAADPQTLANCDTTVDFAIAYGAALALQEKTQSTNFRNDFMPYQGKKVRLQKALKVASYSVTILMIAVGLYFQTSLWKVNRGRSAAHKKFTKDYSSVMLGKELPDKINPVKKLNSELTRIKDVKKGLINAEGEKSISSKLTMVLQAFNSNAAQTGLNIDSITITDKINITGDTSSRGNTLRLFEAIKKAELEILQQRLDEKEGRDNFTITVMPKN
jgi:hypothetical protein